MSLKSNVGELTITQSMKPLLRTATAAGTDVDTTGAGSVSVLFELGTITDGTFTIAITECATSGGSYTDVPAANIVGTLAVGASTLDDRSLIYGVTGKRLKFIAGSVVVTGSPGTGGTLGSSVILGSLNKV